MPYTKGVSTSEIIRRCQEAAPVRPSMIHSALPASCTAGTPPGLPESSVGGDLGSDGMAVRDTARKLNHSF